MCYMYLMSNDYLLLFLSAVFKDIIKVWSNISYYVPGIYYVLKYNCINTDILCLKNHLKLHINLLKELNSQDLSNLQFNDTYI